MAVRRSRILIAGAGPTGLTAAVELARLGFRPRIVDRRDGPAPLSKAVGISARSLELLEPSGATEPLLTAGIRVRHVHLHADDRELATLRFSGIGHRFDFLLALPQSKTEAILADILKGLGVEVDWQTSLTGLTQSSDMVTVDLNGLDGRERVQCDFLYGADGVRSTVRKAIGQSFGGHTHARVWSIADAVIGDWPWEAGSANAFLHRGGDIGFAIPIGRERFRVVSNTPDALARLAGSFQVSQRLREDTFHIPVRQAASYQRGRVFLGGDAAHVHSPVGGRGMNLGIEDAASFARRAAADDLDGYTEERHPVGARWIGLSERALATFQTSSAVTATVRNTVLRIVDRTPGLQRALLRRVSGLTR